MVLVDLCDVFMNVVLFSEEDVGVLFISELTESWERVVVLCEVVLLLWKVMVVFPKVVTILFGFLVSVVRPVFKQVVLLLGFEVIYFAPGIFSCVLVESAGLTERPFRITGSFLWLLEFCSEMRGTSWLVVELLGLSVGL